MLNTRKDCINASEAFLESAFLGLTAQRSDRARLSMVLGTLARIVPNSVDGEADDRPEPGRRDLQNAVIWALSQPRLGLSQRTAHILYLRAHCQLSWKTLAEKFRMSWDGVRKEYDDACHDIYYAVVVRLPSE